MAGGQEGDAQAREKEHCSDVLVFIEYDAPLDGQMALMCRNAQKFQGGWEGWVGRGVPELIPPHPLIFVHFVSLRANSSIWAKAQASVIRFKT